MSRVGDKPWATPKEWTVIFALLVIIVALLTVLGMVAQS